MVARLPYASDVDEEAVAGTDGEDSESVGHDSRAVGVPDEAE